MPAMRTTALPAAYGLRSRLTARAADRARTAQLRDELASYRTPAERAELGSLLGRHIVEQAREFEAALHRLPG
jgi:hypothetical protein